MKKFLSCALVTAVLLSNGVCYCQENKDNSENKIGISYEKDENSNLIVSNENWFYADGFKTYYLPIMEFLDDLESHGFNYKEHFSEEEIDYFKKRDRELLERRNSSILYRTTYSKYYHRFWVDQAEVISLSSVISGILSGGTTFTLEGFWTLLKGSLSKYISMKGTLATIKELKKGALKEGYMHYVKTPYNNESVEAVFYEPEHTSKWIHKEIYEYTTSSYPKEREYYGKFWYYIEDDVVCGADGDEWKIIDNKWYRFDKYGRLIEYSGWELINGKWMYFIPGNFGAYLSTTEYINNEKFTFDSNGYCVEGRGCN